MLLEFRKISTDIKQGRHGWQGPQGLGLAWILQNRKWRRQRWHAADVAATVAALPGKNWPWRPCTGKVNRILFTVKKNSGQS